ncbi:MAG TPA: hypothetical protein VIR61_02775 [Sulfuricaulis sp.]
MKLAGLFIIALLLCVVWLPACQKKPQVPPPSFPKVERPVHVLNFKTGSTLTIRIPHQTLVERGGVPGVFVLNQDGRARFRMVRTGRFLASQVEILSGLLGNETLIRGDLTAVHDGSPVTVIKK